jgi:glycosyltransferase involved in cell wall biosynthesis
MTRSIAVLVPADISKIQGSTEANYVVNFLAENYDTHIYSRVDPEIDDSTYHKIPDSSVVPALFLYNIFLIPYFLYQNHKNQFDTVYTYKGLHLTPFFMSQLSGCAWIADFRTKPTGQAKEWARLSNASHFVIRLYYELHEIFYKNTLSYASAIITLSEPIKSELCESYDINPTRIHLVPLGVDSNEFSPKCTHDGYTEPLDIVYIGSIGPKRGIDTCIHAVASEELETDVRLHLVGDGTEEDLQQLRDTSREHGADSKIEWHGYIDHSLIPQILDEMDVAVSPLPNHDSYKVSSPAKIFEYLSMGLPIICSDIRAHRHLLTEGKTAFFFEPESKSSFIQSINRISELDSTTWQKIHKEARSEGKYHDWSNRMRTIESVVENSGITN